MSEVVIAGIGQIPVGEHWDVSLRSMAARAILAAIKDAGGMRPQALYVGNFLGPVISHQSNLGVVLVDNTGLGGIESFTIEAAAASGAGALRMGYMAVASGWLDTVAVIGVEKFTDSANPQALEAAIAQSQDYDYESMQGMTAASQAGLLMQRYLHQYKAPRDAFSALAALAHANAVHNPNAMFRKAINLEAYRRAGMVSDPVNLLDMAPYADGAAAVLISRSDLVFEELGHPLVRMSGSSSVIDTLALHDRPDPLAFSAARISVERACRKAGILPSDVDLFELSDPFTIYAILSLEAGGFAAPGEGWRMAQEGCFDLDGAMPIQTMGGFKARGNPLAATGVYQAVEASLQLRGEAGPNQVKGAHRALIQSLGGPASTAVSHVLERWPM
ncbi:MAG TPA: thiolase domain-containing protein [Levilinea sp.]|nr:thiolase domain-containing protein [Levilinea sp.]